MDSFLFALLVVFTFVYLRTFAVFFTRYLLLNVPEEFKEANPLMRPFIFSDFAFVLSLVIMGALFFSLAITKDYGAMFMALFITWIDFQNDFTHYSSVKNWERAYNKGEF